MASFNRLSNNSSRFSQLVQVFLSFVLLLGILQLFLEDLSLVARWPWTLRRFLVVSAIIIDSILTLEFGIRSGKALIHKNLFHYMLREFGWVDFVSSLPLLILDSGPRFLALVSGVAISGSVAGIFGIFRIVRFVRIIRLLRFTRLLKAAEQFKESRRFRTQGTNPPENSSSLITNLPLLTLTGILISSILFTFLVEIVGFRGTQPALEAHYNGIIQDLSERDLLTSTNQVYAQTLGSINPGILGIAQRGRVIYAKDTATYRSHQYGVLDYVYLSLPENETEFYISTLDFQADDALRSLQLFILSLVLLQLMYFFGPRSQEE